MSIFRPLDDMRQLLRRRNWQELETTFERRCRLSAGLELTERISRLEFDAYEEQRRPSAMRSRLRPAKA